MNLQQLTSALPKPWLNISANSLTASTAVIENIDLNTLDVNTVDSETIKSNDLLLNQNAVVGVPDNGYSMLYADNLNRLKVASQLAPTETIAYQSDMPATNEIISLDTFSRVRCSDGDNITASINGVNMMVIDDGFYLKTKSSAPYGAGSRLVLRDDGVCALGANDINKPYILMDTDGFRLSGFNEDFQILLDASRIGSFVLSPLINAGVFRDDIDATNQIFKCGLNVERLRINENGLTVNNAYKLPVTDGTDQAVLKTNGTGQASWVAPSPAFSSYAKVIVTGIARQSLIAPLSVLGSLTIPANKFELGSVWKLSAYGVVSVAAAQTVVLSILLNGVVVAFTPALSMANSPTPWSSSWVLTVQAVGAGGVARLATGSTNRLDSSVVCSNSVEAANFNTTVANVFGFTSTLSLAGDNITCESVSFSRVV